MVARAVVSDQADFQVAVLQLYPRDVVSALALSKQSGGSRTLVGRAARDACDVGLVLASLQHSVHVVTRHSVAAQGVHTCGHGDGLVDRVATHIPELADPPVALLRRRTDVASGQLLALSVAHDPAVSMVLIGVRSLDDTLGDVPRIVPRVGFLQLSLKFGNSSVQLLKRSVGVVDESCIGVGVDVNLSGVVAHLGQLHLGGVDVDVLLVDELPLAVGGVVGIHYVVVDTIGHALGIALSPAGTVVELHAPELAFYIGYVGSGAILLGNGRGNTDGVLVVTHGLDVPEVAGRTSTCIVDEATFVRAQVAVARLTPDTVAAPRAVVVEQDVVGAPGLGVSLVNSRSNQEVLASSESIQTVLVDGSLSSPCLTTEDVALYTHVTDGKGVTRYKCASLRLGNVPVGSKSTRTNECCDQQHHITETLFHKRFVFSLLDNKMNE